MAAIVMSHIINPINIAILYMITWAISYSAEVLARTEPYIPNQKRIVNGLEIDIKNPEKKERAGDSSLLLVLEDTLPACKILSIPE